MVDIPTQFLNQQPLQKKKGKLPIIIAAIVALVVIAAGMSFIRKSNSPAQKVIPLVEKKLTPSPSPTFKPVDKASVRIQVVNGTGTPGQATSVVDALKKAGYAADNIKTGNADKFDNTVTTITARIGFENAASDIQTALSSTFDGIKQDSSSLGESSTFDIVILTGGKLFETPTPKPTVTGIQTATPTPTDTNTPTPTLGPTPTL